MFNNRKKIDLKAFSSGTVISLDEVNDEVFSTKMMGEGFAIYPEGDSTLVVAPFDAEVINIFPTKHAVSLKVLDKIEILLHFGLDTVELEGVPFEIMVNKGDKIKYNQPLAKINLKKIREFNKGIDLIFVIPDSKQYKKIDINTGNFEVGESIGQIQSQ